MSEVEDVKQEVKPSRGSYYVVHQDVNGQVWTTEFGTKREMQPAINKMSKSNIVGIFKGRQLAVKTRQVYQID